MRRPLLPLAAYYFAGFAALGVDLTFAAAAIVAGVARALAIQGGLAAVRK